MTRILQALKEGQYSVAEKLINTKTTTVNEQDDHGLTALHIATIDGKQEIIHRLLEAGCDPNISCHLDQKFDEIESDDAEDIINTLRSLGNKTPLHIAAKESYLEIGRMLLVYNADPNATDAGMCTPLHWSAAKGDIEFARILLENSAISDLQDLARSTPLHEAVRNRRIDVIKLLMQYKANPYVRDIVGKSAIDLAENDNQILALLYSHNNSLNTSGILH